ncbi:methylmalonyl-CoA mutase, N-terminal domain/subunit [Bernardetia litoralis DSM 6794]|uniref:Methylmalonyl-CoA mutase, N-terminal domain/subunit n=1 Tax=Bernardetia litoralis (strain ATCC 23117 / DSM 6794 / NBRC 15988 / NCIMB 1366 / Fx l1 / Sio-4) TaxID=880071 RepID=I4AF02_BERLS|nr:methylmalonyl-CoA mutase family protein [Bernardetia litoralis]AFM02537.1 methylmalonyl-CoA mutase, N-terminal domain/subunit [Bernardetia litoralis DSM 6794]
MFVDNFENQSEKIDSESIPNSLKKKWLETATKFLKGKPYQDLEWEFSEGISVEPYYTKDENSDFSYLEILQNNQLALNEPVSQPRFWYNQPFIQLNSLDKKELEKVNKEICQVLMRGAEGVLLDLRNIELDFFDKKTVEILFSEVALSYCAVSFLVEPKTQNQLQDFSKKYIDYANEKGFELNTLTGGVLYSDLLAQNNEFSASFLESISESKDSFHPISLQLNNSEDEAQDIAALLLEVQKIVEKSNPAILKNIQFIVKGTDSFFVMIAKMRALNWLLIQMYDLYEVDCNPYIHSITTHGTDEKSLQDENWNLIRNTTQAFSCILGGTNALSVVTHPNEDKEKSKKWSSRIARNVSIMLREESFIDKNADPISGSYYCEQMTDKLIASAWEKFQKIIS